MFNYNYSAGSCKFGRGRQDTFKCGRPLVLRLSDSGELRLLVRQDRARRAGLRSSIATSEPLSDHN